MVKHKFLKVIKSMSSTFNLFKHSPSTKGKNIKTYNYVDNYNQIYSIKRS